MMATVASRPRRRSIAPLVERRFPLHLEPTLYSIRDLYHAAKKGRWDPEKHIPWQKFEASRYTARQREAAALSWSRRAWTEYGGMPETPAILIRFCLEHGGESDPKMFLCVRGTEEAWHVECCYRFAEQLGGYVMAPRDPDYQELFNQGFHREAFDPAVIVDAYIAAHVAVQGGLDLELYRGYLRNATDPVAMAILKRLVQDKERHVTFGWVYLTERAKSWSTETREDIAAEVRHAVDELELKGYHCAWLVPGGAAREIVEADTITRAAGLGANAEEEEHVILKQFLSDARGQFAKLGIELPRFSAGRLGDI
jgi:hypothetical protein